MITPENLTYLFDNLKADEITKAFESHFDYLAFECHIFNTGCNATLEAFEYSEKREQEITNNGNLFCDKETFLQLFKDSDSLNPFLIELIK